MRWTLTGIAILVCSAQASAQAPAEKNLCAKANQPIDPSVLLTNIGRTGAKIADLHRLCRAETKVRLGFGTGSTVEGYITYVTPSFFEVQFLPNTVEPRHPDATVIHVPLSSLRSLAPQVRGTVHLEIRTDR